MERFGVLGSPWLERAVVNVSAEVFERMESAVKDMLISGHELTRVPAELAKIGRAEKKLEERVDGSSEGGGKAKDPKGKGKYGVEN